MQQGESLGTRCIALTKFPHSSGRIWQCVCFLAFFFIVVDSAFLSSSQPLVSTKWGKIRGKWTKSHGVRGNRLIANFLGIPYALPPVGELRFKSPQRWNRQWVDIMAATTDGPKCIQWSKKMSKIVGNENCLFLNIFVPTESMDMSEQQTKLPVLVFVHGGRFHSGSNNSTLYAPDYLIEQDVILVTVNYRLNIFGFFSTTNEASPGNYGLKDIKIALEWIRENIRSFHGNPESVTLMGHSAGAAIIHFLSLTSKTEGLFHKYILHSGSASAPWALKPRIPYRQICLEVARLVGCLPRNETQNYEGENQKRNIYDAVIHNSDYYNLNNDEEMMNCMRTVDAKVIGNVSEYFTDVEYGAYCIFGPTLEDDSKDAIVTIHPLLALKNGLFRDMPAIMLVVKDEGLVKTLEFYLNENTENEFIKNFEEYLPYFTESQLYVSNTSAFAAAIQDFYFHGNLTVNFTHRVTNMLSDAVMIWPMFQTLQYQSKAKSNIYFSYFVYQGTFSYTSASGKHYGVSHSDELNYFFPTFNTAFQDLMLQTTSDDVTIINIMTEMWTSFIKEGVPRAWLPWFNSTRYPWPDYRDRHQFMKFNKMPDIVVETDFLSDRMEFWEKLMPNVSAEILDELENSSSMSCHVNVCHKLKVQLVLLIIILFRM